MNKDNGDSHSASPLLPTGHGRRAVVLASICLMGLSVAAIATAAGLGCSDTNLYSPSHDLRQADRVGFTGRVCTEDPVDAEFPLRVVLVVDESNGPLFSDYDSAGQRIDVLRDFVQGATGTRENELAIIGYGGQPRQLAPESGSFTRNPGELNAALTQLRSPEPCFAEDQCRNLRGAIQLTRALIEDDLAQTPRGLRALTQYTVIHLHSGPPSPLADGAQCCDEADVECLDEESGPSFQCEAQLAGQAVSEMRQGITDRGGAGLRYHTIHWAAEPSDEDDGDLDDDIQPILEEMAFVGQGTSARFNQVGGFSFASVNLLGHRVAYHAKVLLASNMNVLPGPDGPRIDSDADGIADEEEIALGTSPTNPDTSGDGISDLVKILAGLDPLETEDEPFPGCGNLPRPDFDTTADGLTDCDNRVLGTDPTLTDTSGDGIPDVLEAYFGTNYLERDAHLDYDGDGVANGEEIRQHSDPRSADAHLHLPYGYRYEISDEGFVRDLRAEHLREVTGVRIIEISEGSTAGVGDIFFDAQEQTVRWKDAADDQAGPAVDIHAEQPLKLPSSSWAPEQGDDGRFVEVEVDLDLIPDRTLSERVRIIFRDRQCLRYTIRNIKLVPTLELDDGTPAGTNNILLFLAQAPDGRNEVPSPYRIASIPVRFDPPDRREPADALIEVDDDQFVRPRVFSAFEEEPPQ